MTEQEMIDATKKCFLQYTNIQLSDVRTKEILESSVQLRNDLKMTGGYDTTNREILLDAFGRLYLGMRWPIYMDTEEYSKNFFDKLESITRPVQEKLS